MRNVLVESGDFCKLALAEFDSVRRLARFLAPRSQDADDLVQDTFLRAFRSSASFEARPGGAGIRPWLYRILNNVVKDRMADEQRRSQLADNLRAGFRSQIRVAADADGLSLDGQSLASLSELNWESVDERLKTAINDLTPILRTPFLLYAAGLHYREIAQVVETPVGTVMSRLYRARQLLSTRLASLAADRGLPRPPSTSAAADARVASEVAAAS